MNIKNMTIGEILNNKQAVAVLKKYIPEVMKSPMLGLAKNLKAEQVIQAAGGYLPAAKLQQMLKEVEACF